MTKKEMHFLTFIIGITSREFFNYDRCKAYRALKESGALKFYLEFYDTSHTIGERALLDEIEEIFSEEGVEC